jgi:hypothetical protein
LGSSRGSARRRRPTREVGSTGARFPSPATAEDAAEADEAALEVDDAEAQADTNAEASAQVEAKAEVDVDAEEAAAEIAEPPATEELAEPEPQPVEATADEPEEPAAEPAEPHAEDVPAAEAAEVAEAAEADEAEEPLAESAPAEAATDAEPAEKPAQPEAAADEPAAEPEAPEVPSQRPESIFVAAAEPDVDDFESDDVRSWVRPYVWTGGRTSTSLEFALETLVSAREQDRDEVLRDVHQQVLELCEKPRSVSEIAALLSVPLGAAKALLGVMAEENLLVVHRTGNASGEGPGLELMERVLRGLRKL